MATENVSIFSICPPEPLFQLQIEDSLLQNEAHRLELQEAISRLEKSVLSLSRDMIIGRELEQEQQALEESKAANKELRRKNQDSQVSRPVKTDLAQMHPLLLHPGKRTGCHLDLDLEPTQLVCGLVLD